MIPVHPQNRLILGMLWNGQLLVDSALPFGLCCTPRMFTVVADVLEWSARFEGIESLMHYLDDFLITAPANFHRCREDLDREFVTV